MRKVGTQPAMKSSHNVDVRGVARGDIRTWTHKGTHPSMEGKKPGDSLARFCKVAAYR
jgi:hypothetical protein